MEDFRIPLLEQPQAQSGINSADCPLHSLEISVPKHWRLLYQCSHSDQGTIKRSREFFASSDEV